jgi:hypothetical protein
VLLDATADGPMTCGVVRPAIILPSDARQWSMEDLRRASFDVRVRPLHLSAREKEDLRAFLGALSGKIRDGR